MILGFGRGTVKSRQSFGSAASHQSVHERYLNQHTVRISKIDSEIKTTFMYVF